MVGIFGYISEKPINDDYNKISKLIEKQNYSIKKSIIGDNCILHSLNISSENSTAETQKKEDINIISCGNLYTTEQLELEKVLLELYKKDELYKIKKYNGVFAAAIFDQLKNQLILINDRNGPIKVFYTYINGNFIFSPMIKPLLELGAEKKIDKGALVEFLTFGSILSDRTLVESIKILKPGTILKLSKNKITIDNYHSYENVEEFDNRPKEILASELKEIWQKAVDIRLKKEGKIYALLSGGLDSRAIISALLKSIPRENLTVFTYGEQKSYEYIISDKITTDMGINKKILPTYKKDFEKQYFLSLECNEAMIDATPYFPIFEYQKIESITHEIFSGYLGGELMGPGIFKGLFKKYRKIEEDIEFRKNFFFNYHKLNDKKIIENLINPEYIAKADLFSSYNETIKDIEEIPIEKFPNYCAIWLFIHGSPKNTAFTNFRFRNKFRYILPFLDNDLIDFVLKIPPKLRYDKNFYKYMLLNHYPELFKYPTKNSFGLNLNTNKIRILLRRINLASKVRINKISTYIIKRNIFFNKLENYIDYNNLLRTNNEYRDFIKLNLDKVKKRNYFNQSYIDLIWQNHMKGKKNYINILALLVTFELFLEKFFKE